MARLVAYIVLSYGLIILAETLTDQLRLHGRHLLHATVLLTLPVIGGISYVYLGTLLLRLKRNAWLVTLLISAVTIVFDVSAVLHRREFVHEAMPVWLHVIVPCLVLLMLIASRSLFRVRSDTVAFRQALRVSVLILVVTLLYGVGGFTLLDQHDFHQEISVATAVHQTLDQFGLTTTTLVPYTRRAQLFTDSLSLVSVAAVGYVVLAFFQPIRARLTNQGRQRQHAVALLEQYPSDLDDYFKLWPHDKLYFFDETQRAGVAYHVSRGVALVAGDPFGDPGRFGPLLEGFLELCFVNDWQPAFVHITDTHRALYENLGFRLQKLGEEAVLDLRAFQAVRGGKYFRQIRNRFTKLGYQVELLQPPHEAALLRQLRNISDEWLARPGREERGFMLGYFDPAYLQAGPIAVVRDQNGCVQGFMNLVPTYEPHSANYDLLRCGSRAPGNCNDFLLLGLIDSLVADGTTTLNLGLCPLAGLDGKADEAGLIDTALRLVYAGGDRFYSFSGLHRFKAKYHPEWQDRYVAYRGGVAGFTRAMTALTRAMKVT